MNSAPGRGWRRAGTTEGGVPAMARLTVKGRLTLVYAVVFAIGGMLLLGMNYAFVASSMLDRKGVLLATPASPAPKVMPTPGSDPLSVPSPAAPTGSGRTSDTLTRGARVWMAEQASERASVELIGVYRAGVLSDLLVRSSLVLVGAIGLATIAGRIIAGRTLARLHHITETARRLSERDLNRRLALNGPRDELKELADTFDGMLSRLQAAFDSQRRFAANASHELRTPLAIQRAAVEVPLATGRVPDHLMPAMHRVLDAAQRSERLIEGLLLLARGERGPSELRRTPAPRCRLRRSSACSRPSTGATEPGSPARAAPAWGCPSSARSPTPTTAPSRPRPARAAGSRSWSSSPYPRHE